MTKDEAIANLKSFGAMSAEEQSYRSTEIEEAFYVFWASSPTREQFADTMSRVLLTARILWTMTPPAGGIFTL